MRILNRLYLTIALVSCSTLFSFSQKLKTEGYEISPAELRCGSAVTLKINPEKCEPLVKDQPVYAVMLTYAFGKMKAYDVLMKPGKGMLTASFNIPDSVDAVAFKFMQGNEYFNNNGHGIKYSVKDKNGNAQTASLYSLYRLQMNDYQAGITKGREDVAERFFNKWYEKGDFANVSFFDMSVVLHRRKDTVALRNHLSKIGQAENLTELQFTNIISRYAPLCGVETRLQVEAERKKRFPEGEWYWKKWRDSLVRLQTPGEKMGWIKAFMLAYPEEVEKGNPVVLTLHREMLYSLSRGLDMKAFHMAAAYIDKKPEQIARSFYDYNTVFSQALAKDTLIAELMPIAKKVTQRIHSMVTEDIDRDPTVSPQMHYLDRYRYYIVSASTYGAFLTATGSYDSAAYYTRKAVDFYNWKSPYYNERYFKAAINLKNPTELLEELKIAFRKNAYTPPMKTMFLQLCEKSGIADGAGLMATIMNERKMLIRQRLRKDMLSDPAPEFTLAKLNGGEVTLSSLKGKVILLDFWATWCAPCIASFPSMQKLVDANKENKEVSIYFVDTWQTEKNKYDVVNNFFKNKPYRFDVLMDLDDTVVKSYNITGIPSKVIIDKKGVIRFISVGFDSDEEKAVDELQAMLELAAE